ncbi:hypothetical protein D1BOALGB6SA_2139 [Olavius sp. associated proteobacterium Delta 1]|nr:hypothetical protein D1BOALGB6SA_2139 [Olavius sp. associated proteobacterium Delta 1]
MDFTLKIAQLNRSELSKLTKGHLIGVRHHVGLHLIGVGQAVGAVEYIHHGN